MSQIASCVLRTVEIQPSVKGIKLREAGFNSASQIGATIDISKGMKAQKGQKGSFQLQLTGLESKKSAHVFIGKNRIPSYF